MTPVTGYQPDILSQSIARMICPSRAISGWSAPGPDQYDDLVRACIANKIPVLSIDTSEVPELESFFASEAFQKAWQEEQDRWLGFRREYIEVRRAFEQSGITDVMIKAAGIAPALTFKSDNLDILVSLEQGARAKEILHELGYIELVNVEEPHKFLFRKFRNATTVSAIHLHEFVGWGTGFMSDEDVLSRARPADDDTSIHIPCPEHALMITMAHAFYEDKEIKLGDLWKVSHVLQTHQLDWKRIYYQAMLRGWREGLDTCIWLWAELERALYGRHSFPLDVVERAQQQAPAYCRNYVQECLGQAIRFPFGVSFAFSKRHYYGKVVRDQGISSKQKAIDIWLHSWAGIERRLPLKRQRRFLVSLSGIDGSGKTTHARALAMAFAECDIRTNVVWSLGASSRFTDALIRMVRPFVSRSSRAATPDETREKNVARKSAWLQKPVLRWGWTAMTVVDLFFRYLRRIALPLLIGRMVVADRYTGDALVELAVLMDRTEVAEVGPGRLWHRVCPTPNLSYYLDIDAQEALMRKPDESVDYLACQVFVYRHMARLWGMEILDASEPQEIVMDAIVNEVLEQYYARW